MPCARRCWGIGEGRPAADSDLTSGTNPPTIRTVNTSSVRKQLKEFVAAAHEVAEARLLFCASGNLSWRVSEHRMLITGTGSWLGRLTPAQVSICDPLDETVIEGCAPSKEIGFHAGILRERPDVKVVLHFQSPHATTIACCGALKLDYFMVAEVPYYIGPVASIPYLAPGSRELADAVTAACREHDCVVLRNHGQVAVGRTFEDVIQKAVVFEQACQIILEAGGRLKTLSPRAVKALLAERSRSLPQ
jgi:ribulose-5-phosphate 4-epimerase/fuculose-1-phosphate aldolase